MRYHEVDSDAYELSSSQHLNRFLGRDETDEYAFKPIVSTEEEVKTRTLLSGKDVAKITHLRLNLFLTRTERDRRRSPYLTLVGILRFDLESVLQWELDNSIPGIPQESLTPQDTASQQSDIPERFTRWYEIKELCLPSRQ